ncbi:inactive pancreatic lipase-related protein 1 [Trichonephila clavipes]|nr:inactive pancreatic lipase-related protein 1 [Trichonephila clavipes]
MRFSLQTGGFLLFFSVTYAYQTFLRQILGSALMGDLLSTLPSRFQCVGAGKNFTHFLLFSRIHPDKPHPLMPDDQELLVKSDYDPSVPTKIIIHGFVDNLHLSDWMQRMKTRFLSEGDYNVIIVDWSCGNEFPYFQAIQNSKIVADELKKLLNFLRDSRGADPGDFHLIGHSLGSHIAGLVGHGVPHLGRISGKKELIEWCIKEGWIASSYERPKCNDRHDVTGSKPKSWRWKSVVSPSIVKNSNLSHRREFYRAKSYCHLYGAQG